MNSYIFHICFILFILLSYLIFDFVCLTLSSADTHGIAKYALTYIRDTHTLTHTKKETKVERIKKKRRGGVRKERKRERAIRKGGKRRRKMREKGGREKKKNKKESGRGLGG